MLVRIFSSFLAIGLLLTACKTKQKTTTKNDTPVETVQLYTLHVISTEPKKEIYQETNPRLNDVIHTRLDVSFDWAKSWLIGTATIDMKQYFYPSRMCYLNARGMDIKKLEVFELTSTIEKKKTGNKTVEESTEKYILLPNATYKYENDSLKIDLGREFTSQEKYRVIIDYVSKPNELKQGGSNAISSDKGLYFINPKGENPYKMIQLWTQGETQSNSAWFPTIDSPNEKMTQDIYITVFEKMNTLSNGLLVESKKNADDTRTDHWKMDLPHAPYLVMMAVGNFQKVVDEPWNGKEISYYVEKEYEPHAKGIFGNTREMIEFYSNRLGVPYPWQKYAQVAVRDYVSGAMENTSAMLHGDFVVYQTTREMIDGKKGEDVIAHELFHQWFGDYVTCESWSNLPLNESFATYGEYLWNEYKYGRDAADHHHAQSRSGYMRSDEEVNLVRFNYRHREDMFDAFSYNKGGQVLHMLRKVVGDEAFFASLKNYLETNKFKAAEIHHLRLAFEETTGQDLNWFFNQWFLNKGRPKLKINQSYKADKGVVELRIEQVQDFKIAPLYRLPVQVDVYCNGKAQRTKIWITEKTQTLSIKSECQPQLVNFDAERQLLADLEYEKSVDEYIFQYKNAPLYDDRMEALKKLESKMNDDKVFEIFKWAAEFDKFYAVRNYAVGKLDNAPAAKMPEVKTTWIKVYNQDKHTRTRAKALSRLNLKYGKDADIMALNEKALNEASYAINAEALEMLSSSNPSLAMEKAKAFKNEYAKEIIFPVANLYANNGSDEQILFFQNNLKYIGGFEMITYMSAYTKLAKRVKDSGAAITAAMDMEAIAKDGNKLSKFGALKGIKDLASVWEGKEKALKAKIEAEKKENKNVAALEAEMKTAAETKDILLKMYNRNR